MSDTDPRARLAEKFQSLRRRFRDGLTARLAVIDACVAGRSVDELTRHLHSLGGSAATYEFHHISTLATQAEGLCRNGWESLPALQPVLSDLHDVVRTTLESETSTDACARNE
jgi:HPt (histidine-containing phosphotransfer) domain-containing protein